MHTVNPPPYYRHLVERLVRLGRVQDAARVREKLGNVLCTVARYEEALGVLEQGPVLDTRTWGNHGVKQL